MGQPIINIYLQLEVNHIFYFLKNSKEINQKSTIKLSPKILGSTMHP